MDSSILVVYSWTAKEGKLDALKTIYQEVVTQMEEKEPGAKEVEFFVDEVNQSIVVRDLFEDGQALGFHLQNTAAQHFGDLMQIATPGTFYFCGEVPEEMKQAISSMGLRAHFCTRAAGFKK